MISLFLIFRRKMIMNIPKSLYYLLLILCINCIQSGSMYAGTNIDNAVFSIRPNNVDYLRYLHIQNQFDSAIVGYTIGEFRIISSGNESKIALSSFPNEFTDIEGDSTIGIDPILLPLTRTASFTLPSSGEVKFYRELMVTGIPCNTEYKGGSTGGGTGGWQDAHWIIGSHKILDQTEFVVEIIRESDNTIIGTIDSVGVLPNPATKLALRYGTEPDSINHHCLLPSGYGGTKVYLRVSPRRNGPTPYGLVMRKITSWVSLSTLFERSPTSILKCSHSDLDTLRTRYVNEVIDYSDSVKLATGSLPGNFKLFLQDSVHTAAYLNRYYVDSSYTDSTYGNIRAWEEKDSLQFATEYYSSPILTLVKSQTAEIQLQASIESISPNPITDDKALVKINVIDNQNVINSALVLYSYAGNKIATLWSGSLRDETISVSLKQYNNGVYFLFLENYDGKQIDKIKLIINR
jgi:hypothetical protein